MPKLLQFFHSLRPILFEKLRKGAVGKQFASSLAARTVIRFIIGISDALNSGATVRTWLAKPAMHRHSVSKCGHPFRKSVARDSPQLVSPVEQSLLGCTVKPIDLFTRKLLGERHGRKARAVQDLI